MLERVALHQTRLRTPGLSLDARGVAVGAKGLVVFPSLDRLVSFFSVYTAQHALDELVAGLRIELGKSKLRSHAVMLTFAAGSGDRMDGIADVARLTGGTTFTGGGRHWVQYRDASAPFGYDISQVTQGDAAYYVYHLAYEQAFDVEREVALRSLLMRLSPRLDARKVVERGPRWLLAQWGLGAPLIHYLRRSHVSARAGVIEGPPKSELEDEPVRQYLIYVEDIPARMAPLFTRTPGVRAFAPITPGAAVELGFTHPITLGAIPFFRGPDLVLFRGGEAPLAIATLPVLGDVASLARHHLVQEAPSTPFITPHAAPAIDVPLRLLPSCTAAVNATATWVPAAQLPLLRRLMYTLGRNTLMRAKAVFATDGAFVLVPGGVDALPIGTFYRAVAPSVYIPVGYDIAPVLRAEVLEKALSANHGAIVVVRAEGAAWSIEEAAFEPLERAVANGQRWAPLTGQGFSDALSDELPSLTLISESLGVAPLRDIT